VKRALGNPGKRPLPTEGALAAVPALELETHELTVPQALERVLHAGVRWLGQTDAPTVALLRDALEDYAVLRGSPGADPKNVIAARKQVMELLSSLGFDPTARSRLGLAEVKAADALDQIIARKRHQ
jgi:hypothetical protein